MTDAEILQAINLRLGKLPGTRTPELNQILALMTSMMIRLEARVSALQPASNSHPEPIVALAMEITPQAGQSSGASWADRRRFALATRKRAKL